MAYTRPWAQVLNLLGSRDADEIDDGSREAHTDFTERFTDILYDPAADPWKVRVPGVAIDGLVSYGLPAPAAVVTAGNAQRNDFDIQNAVVGASIGVIFPVQAVAGSTLVAFEIKGYRTLANAVVQAKLISLDATTETFSVESTVTLDLIQPTIQIKNSGALNISMPSNKSFYISVLITADNAGADNARLSSVYYTIKLAGV